MYYYSNQSINR